MALSAAKLDLFIGGLLVGMDITAAAQKANVSRRTAFRLLKDPAFRERLDTARREALSRCQDFLATITLEAGQVLRTIMNSDANPAIRVRAAQIILETAFRAEAMDVAALHEELRELLQEKK